MKRRALVGARPELLDYMFLEGLQGVVTKLVARK
jgi:hypothetical protein